jgi:hypothetical protein
MSGRFILYILTCGPLLLTLAAWMRLYWAPRDQRHALALLALGIASANAAFGLWHVPVLRVEAALPFSAALGKTRKSFSLACCFCSLPLG